MRNDDNSCVVEGLDVNFKPDEGYEIQVIGRLIEHEDLWLAEDDLGDRDSHSPSSRELLGRPGELLFGETKTNQDQSSFGWSFSCIN
jgi:hypothetical protein|tara:strand:+ start:1125 stop:1385 length:261 start_codon:yes stop_codon:yes gene_type:complete